LKNSARVWRGTFDLSQLNSIQPDWRVAPLLPPVNANSTAEYAYAYKFFARAFSQAYSCALYQRLKTSRSLCYAFQIARDSTRK
jgi:hypothetical protein